MIGTFKANNPLNTFLLFVYGLLLKFGFLSNTDAPVIKRTDGFLFAQLLTFLKGVGTQFPSVYSIITYLLLFTQAVTFNRLIAHQRLLQRSTHLPAMSYLLITSIFAEWNILSPQLIVNTLLIWVWAKVNNLYNSEKVKTNLFYTGLIIGVSSFFYFPSIAFFLLIVFALLITRPFSLAEWIITLVGIIMPYYFFVAGLYLTDNLKEYKLQQFTFGYPLLHANYWPLAAALLVVILLFIGAYFVQANLRRQIVQVRKSWGLILVYLIIAVLVSIINEGHYFVYWIITAVPLSAFVASAFLYPSKKWFPALLYWILVALVVVSCYFIK